MVLTASGAHVVVGARLVVKVHRPGTDATLLARRMTAAARSRAFVPAVLPAPVEGTAGVVTLWRRAGTLDPQAGPDAVPWGGLGALLASLHLGPAGDAPAHGGHDRLARAVRRTSSPVVARAGAAVLAGLAAGGPALVHGDLHLGQVGLLGPVGTTEDPGELALLDVDDVGAGDPAWDLGRPAGFFAAGLLPEAALEAFLDGYRAAGGPGVPARGDPWGRLDAPARAAVVVAAARALEQPGPLDESASALLDACARMPSG